MAHLACQLAAAQGAARPHVGTQRQWVRSCPSSLPRPAWAGARVVRASSETDADTEGLSGEWPVNWSLASYEDVGEFFSQNLFKDAAPPGKVLGDMMSTDLTTTTPDARVDGLGPIFNKVRAQSLICAARSDAVLCRRWSKADASGCASAPGDRRARGEERH